MNDIRAIIEISLFAMAIIMFLLQLFAHFNRIDKYKRKEMHSLNLLWLFHEEIYNDYGKSACRKAKTLLYFALSLGVIWVAIFFLVK